mmetsp:Transcript_26512/g.86691  ORF Transcript_26512/g.86691 Transcript_26512/m.86691 type:complete len:202 (+) Transcript_26512:263-868(+)
MLHLREQLFGERRSAISPHRRGQQGALRPPAGRFRRRDAAARRRLCPRAGLEPDCVCVHARRTDAATCAGHVEQRASHLAGPRRRIRRRLRQQLGGPLPAASPTVVRRARPNAGRVGRHFHRARGAARRRRQGAPAALCPRGDWRVDRGEAWHAAAAKPAVPEGGVRRRTRHTWPWSTSESSGARTRRGRPACRAAGVHRC